MKNIPIDSVMFLDIETATEEPNLLLSTEAVKKEWARKCKNHSAPKLPKESADEYCNRLYINEGALHPEFAKIICISIGIVSNGALHIRSFGNYTPKEVAESGMTEEQLLLQCFCESLDKFKQRKPFARLCAHYGIGFDFPFICKRLLINGFEIPEALQTFGRKPWELTHLDTKEIWKCGGYTSAGLSNIATALGLPTPKDDIDGSEVGHVYHAENDLPRIIKYCNKDVITLANVFRKMRNEEVFSIQKETVNIIE